MSRRGGPPALRGFRLQTLFILDRLLNASEGEVCRLETIEDLCILDASGIPLEFIQVKGYSDPLTVSTLKSRGQHRLFRRVLDRIDSGAKETLASFGPIGPELKAAWEQDGKERRRCKNKLKSFSKREVSSLFSTIKLVEVGEEELERRVLKVLQETLAGGEKRHAFEIVSLWLYRESEKQSSVSRSDLLAKLEAVGRYLAERSTHHREWFTSIRPIESDPQRESIPEKLRSQFYQGVAARYEHIAACVDVPRTQRTAEIAAAFETHRLVVLHGASGQGKSALAYRYLHDYIPTLTRFEVRSIQDLRQAQSITRALTGHAKAMACRLFIYIDVQPRDDHWVEIVNELTRYPGIRILVTVREEDWNRSRVLAWPSFAAIPLTFYKDEARALFQQLCTSNHPPRVLDFDDAWQRFEGRGPLLEFIYLVTQNQTLRRRLELQVQHLERELSSKEMGFLRLIAVASAYGASLKLRELVEMLDLPQPSTTLSRLEREYLVRTSDHGQLVEGLHPVRSELLRDLLVDPALNPWAEAAVEALPVMAESDLEIFLLYAFSRQFKHRDALIRVLESNRPATWTGLGNVLRSLLWLDLREYAEANKEVVEKGVETFGDAWKVLPMWDVANLASYNPEVVDYGFQNLDLIADETKATIAMLREERSAPVAGFEHSRAWLAGQKHPPQDPRSSMDWLRAAEIMFWTGFWHLREPAGGVFREIDPVRALESQPLEIASEVLYAASFFKADGDALDVCRDIALGLFCDQYDVIDLEDDGERVKAHYLWNVNSILAEIRSGVSGKPMLEDDALDPIHQDAMVRVDLLRKILPDRKRVGTQGYGHDVIFPDAPFDSTEKFVDRKYLYPPWAVRLNGIFCHLVDYSRRPDDWGAYADTVLDLRAANVENLICLKKSLSTFFRRQHYISVSHEHAKHGGSWDLMIEALRATPLLPKAAVDEWGFSAEQSRTDGFLAGGDNQRVVQKESIAATKYQAYVKVLGDFTYALSCLYSQGASVLVGTPYKSRPGAWHKKGHLRDILASAGYDDHTTHLSVYNFAVAVQKLSALQEQFRKLLEQFVERERLEAIEGAETDILPQAWALWYNFSHQPRRLFATASEGAVSVIENLAGEFDNKLVEACKTLAQREDLNLSIRVDGPLPGYNGKPTVWFVCDLHDPTEKYTVLEEVLCAIESTWGSGGNRLFEYVQQIFRPQFALTFLFQGCLVQSEAFVFPTHVLEKGEGSLLDLPSWRWSSRTIPDVVLEKFELKFWRHEQIEIFTGILRSFADLRFFLAWLGSMGEVPGANNVSVLRRLGSEGHLCLLVLVRRFLDASVRFTRLLDSSPHQDYEALNLGFSMTKLADVIAVVRSLVTRVEAWRHDFDYVDAAETVQALDKHILTVNMLYLLGIRTLLERGVLERSDTPPGSQVNKEVAKSK